MISPLIFSLLKAITLISICTVVTRDDVTYQCLLEKELRELQDLDLWHMGVISWCVDILWPSGKIITCDHCTYNLFNIYIYNITFLIYCLLNLYNNVRLKWKGRIIWFDPYRCPALLILTLPVQMSFFLTPPCQELWDKLVSDQHSVPDLSSESKQTEHILLLYFHVNLHRC